MTTSHQHDPAETSGRRKNKRNKKAGRKEPAQSLAEASPRQIQPEQPIEAAAPVALVEEAAAVPYPGAAPTAPSPASISRVGIQELAEAYRDYTRKSLQDAQSFAEQFSTAGSLGKAMETQGEFARKACETFVADARKIRELHRELFWQVFRLPG